MITIHQNLHRLDLDDLRELQAAFTRPSETITVGMALEIASQVAAWEAVEAEFDDLFVRHDRNVRRSEQWID